MNERILLLASACAGVLVALHFVWLIVDMLATVALIVGVVVASVGGVWAAVWGVSACLGALQRRREWDVERTERLALVQRENMAAQIVHMDAAGRLPVSWQAIQAGMLDLDAVQLSLAVADAQRTHPVPQTLTYSPHVSYRGGQAGAQDAPSQLPAAFNVPSFAELAQGGQLGRDECLLVGYDMETQQAVYEPFDAFYSSAVSGKTGSGKTTTIRSIAAQMVMAGAQLVVCDPHMGSEQSTATSLLPLRAHMLIEPVSVPVQIVAALELVRSKGRERKRVGQAGNIILLIVDELNAIMRTDAAQFVAQTLEEIAQEYRKYAIYALCIGQIWSARSMGGYSDLRDSFASAVVHRTDPAQARYLISNDDARSVGKLEPGQMVFSKTNGDVWRLAVPNCTKTDIERIAVVPSRAGAGTSAGTKPGTGWEQLPESGTGDTQSLVPGTVPDAVPALDAESLRIIEAFRDGMSVSAIVRDVLGVDSKGRPYQQAAERVTDVLRAELQRTGVRR